MHFSLCILSLLTYTKLLLHICTSVEAKTRDMQRKFLRMINTHRVVSVERRGLRKVMDSFTIRAKLLLLFHFQ